MEADHGREQQPGSDGEDRHGRGDGRPDGERRSQALITDRKVRADHEHQQREADVRQTVQQRVGVVDPPEPTCSDDDTGGDLSDDDRRCEPMRRCEQRPDQAGRHDERECCEVHVSPTSPRTSSVSHVRPEDAFSNLQPIRSRRCAQCVLLLWPAPRRP